MKARVWRATFLACILLGVITRVAFQPIAVLESEKALGDRATALLRVHGFAYLGASPVASNIKRILRFRGPGCAGDVQVVTVDYFELSNDVQTLGAHRVVAYLNWRGPTVERGPIERAHIRNAALAMIGLSPYVVGRTSAEQILEAGTSAPCSALDAVDWRALWKR